MFEKIGNSWELVKASFKVLGADKELLIFPVISTIGAVLVTVVFFVPFFVGGLFDSVFSSEMQIAGFLIMLAYYVVQYTVIFFANTALVGAAMIRLKGGDPTVGDGLRIAAKNFGPILGYALIAATVGVLLKQINERSKGFGRFVTSLIGTAWNIATFLVVPVLAVEGIGPIDAIKRSVSLLKKTWGEQIAGNFGIGAISALVVIAVLVFGGGLIFGAIWLDLGAIPIILAVALVVFLLVVIGLISSALTGIYTAAVYQFATTGETGEFFDDNMVRNAFRLKG